MRSQRVRPEKTVTESATPELTGGLVTA
jgi:hypothetical protein